MQNYWTNPYSTGWPQGAAVQQAQRPLVDWVTGRVGADNYPIGPNGKVMLMDSQEPVMYVKTADAMGRPAIVVFDLVERKATEAESAAPAIDYNQLKGFIADEVKKQISSYAKRSKKEAES